MSVRTKINFLLIFIILIELNLGCVPSSAVSNSLEGVKNRGNVNKEDKGNFLVLKDGQKIPGSIDAITTGVFGGRIRVNDKGYKTKNVKYQIEGTSYYRPVGHYFALRVLKGKLNVYAANKSKSGYINHFNESGYGTYRSDYSIKRIDYYLQKGEEGDLVKWTSIKQLDGFINDCPKAVNMLTNINDEDKKQKGDSSFLIKIINTYNLCND